MASSFSTDLKLELMVTGENAGTWGDKTNTNLNLVQQAIAGYQEVNIAGGAQTTTLVMSNAALSNARNAVIKLTGTITGNQVVTVPDGIEKPYIVSNGTTGAFTVQFKTVSGTGPTFSTTDKGVKILFADGTNIVDVNANFSASRFPQINDSNGNEEIIFTTTASAVNELTIANAATGNAPSISTTGSDTNIGLTIAPKGTGDVNVDADTLRVGDSNADATITTNGTGDLTLSTNAGSNSGTIKIFDAANGNIEITPNGTGVVKLDGLSYPTADGSANQALVTNGSGVLSFAAVGASAGQVIQVVSTTLTTATSTAATGATDIAGLSVTITPSASANKILVLYKIQYSNSSGNNGVINLVRNGTNIAMGASGQGGDDCTISICTANMNSYWSFEAGGSFLDSPSSTSALTYKFQTQSNDGPGVFYFNRTGRNGTSDANGISTITVMEIKG